MTFRWLISHFVRINIHSNSSFYRMKCKFVWTRMVTRRWPAFVEFMLHYRINNNSNIELEVMKFCEIFQRPSWNYEQGRGKLLRLDRDWNNLKRPFSVCQFLKGENLTFWPIFERKFGPAALCFMRSTHYFFSHNLMRCCTSFSSEQWVWIY